MSDDIDTFMADRGHPYMTPSEREAAQTELTHSMAADPQPADRPCGKCGQVDHGQYGEYPCADCGLPTVWDPPADKAPTPDTPDLF